MQRFSQERLGGPPAIDIGRVDQVDAKIEGCVDAGFGLTPIDPDAIGEPGPERDFGDLEVAGAELTIVHGGRVFLQRGSCALGKPPQAAS
jgi:hypothetical protein